MRVVIFTADPAFESSRYWRVVLAMPGLASVLIVRKRPQPGLGPLLRRLRANIRKHGAIFVPYRIAMIGASLFARLRARDLDAGPAPAPQVPVDVIEAVDVHAPDVLDRVRSFAPDLGVSLGAPILRPSLFGIPGRGTINMHLGKVPDFRGAPPGFWELYEGASEIGATIHWVNEGLDTGPVIRQATAPIFATDALEDVEARAAELGELLLAAALASLAHGTPEAVPQPSGVGRTFRMPTLAVRARLAWRLARERWRRTWLVPQWLAKSVAAGVLLLVVRPLRDLWRTVAATHPVRLFNYHRVTELTRDGMTVSPRAFRAQVAYLRRTHHVVPLERALSLLRAHARLRRPVAVITFDDAYASVAGAAAPILARAGLPATVFVCPDLVGTDRRFDHDASDPMREYFAVMGWDELRSLQRMGWSFGAHTANHVRLSETTGSRLRDEIRRPLHELRARFSLDALTLAYPFGQPGDISPAALAEARASGYAAVFSDYGGDARATPDAEFEWRRWDIGGDHATLAWRTQVRGFDLRRWRHLAPARRARV